MDRYSSDDGAGDNSHHAGDQLGTNVLQQYMDACSQMDDAMDKDAVFQQGVMRVKEHLSSTCGSLDCLICLGSIRPQDAVWSCTGGCFAIVHLVCIQDWARNQQEAAGERAASRLTPALFPRAGADAAAAAQWHCPKCRHAYPATQLPKSYTCFCGKVPEPAWDPWLTPHSCGEMCGRELPGSCGHTCTLLCHPGPCPPCPRVVDAACYCGKQVFRRRCGNHEFSCRAVCGAVLECGHTCQAACHPGPCAPCSRQGSFSCACGAETRRLPCSQRHFQCGRPCGKALACGRHVCEQECHAGECGGCPNEGLRTCPCGKTTHTGLRCDERAPSCPDTCGKLLSCGRHHCQEKCHHGPCSKVCRELVTKECRCGGTSRQVQCHSEVVCEKRCPNKRSCGRHPCKRRCCDGTCPPCEEVCNRRLRCGHHKCPAPCHTGSCQPCPLTGRVACACGETKATFLCGKEKQMLPPRCRSACPIPPTCRHAVQRQGAHRCHWGPCPPCTAPCGTVLPCGHTCGSATCHDPRPPSVGTFPEPKPPQHGGAAAAAAANAAEDAGPSCRVAEAAQQLLLQPPSACPPCQESVQVTCLGGHTSRDMPCCTAASFQCDQLCGRHLPCGHHTCAKPCHAPSGSQQGEECLGCSQPCSQPRSCPHPCPLPCHPDACPQCSISCKRPCLCGKTSLSLPCHQHQLVLAHLKHSTQPSSSPAQQQPARLLHTAGPSTAAAAAKAGAAAAGTKAGGAAAGTKAWAAAAGTKAGAAAAGTKAGGAAGGGSDEAAVQPVDVGALLCCGKPCHKQLPHCPHACPATCHAGPCPQPDACQQEVAVRCECRKRKQKWLCSQVQAALLQRGSGRTYDANASLRLLPCSSECQQGSRSTGGPAAAAAKPEAQQAAAATGATGASTAAAGGPAGTAAGALGWLLRRRPRQVEADPDRLTQAVAVPDERGDEGHPAGQGTGKGSDTAAAKAASGGGKRLSRQEREQLALLRQQERQQHQSRELMLKWLARLGVVAVVVVVSALMGRFISTLLRTADQHASAKWRPDGAP